MWWELGEHVALCARYTGLEWLAGRFHWQCRCEARRTWLNQQGEKYYARHFPVRHARLLAQFAQSVLQATERGPCPAEAIQTPVSANTRQRWLDELVKERMLGSLVISGQTLYGKIAPCKSEATTVE